MELKIPGPRRPPSRLVDHLLMWGVSAASLALFAVAWDPYRGPAEVGDALLFTAAFLTTGSFLSRLPRIWQGTDRTRLAGFVSPCFMVLVMAYVALALRTGFFQPTATAIAVLVQSVSLVVLMARSR
jgi:hypothetical protein